MATDTVLQTLLKLEARNAQAFKPCSPAYAHWNHFSVKGGVPMIFEGFIDP
jgi:hypothetical protein